MRVQNTATQIMRYLRERPHSVPGRAADRTGFARTQRSVSVPGLTSTSRLAPRAQLRKRGEVHERWDAARMMCTYIRSVFNGTLLE